MKMLKRGIEKESRWRDAADEDSELPVDGCLLKTRILSKGKCG
jgi:hypothetical protein